LPIELAPGSIGKQVHHPGHELVYVLEGVGVLEVDGKPPFALTPGAATIVDPYHTHVSKNVSQTHRLKLLTVQLLEKANRGLRAVMCLAEASTTAQRAYGPRPSL
jgi:quercetin dioxygenase-like cupin family protein